MSQPEQISEHVIIKGATEDYTKEYTKINEFLPKNMREAGYEQLIADIYNKARTNISNLEGYNTYYYNPEDEINDSNIAPINHCKRILATDYTYGGLTYPYIAYFKINNELFTVTINSYQDQDKIVENPDDYPSIKTKIKEVEMEYLKTLPLSIYTAPLPLTKEQFSKIKGHTKIAKSITKLTNLSTNFSIDDLKEQLAGYSKQIEQAKVALNTSHIGESEKYTFNKKIEQFEEILTFAGNGLKLAQDIQSRKTQSWFKAAGLWIAALLSGNINKANLVIQSYKKNKASPKTWQKHIKEKPDMSLQQENVGEQSGAALIKI